MTAALRTLAQRFGIEGPKRKWSDNEREVGRMAGRLIRARLPGADVRAAVLEEAKRHGIDAARATNILTWIAERELARRGGAHA